MFLSFGDQMKAHGLAARRALTPAAGPVRVRRVPIAAARAARHVVEEHTC